ncbi:MAG: hypothetical protein PME_16340 [Priestia megaterium]
MSTYLHRLESHHIIIIMPFPFSQEVPVNDKKTGCNILTNMLQPVFIVE